MVKDNSGLPIFTNIKTRNFKKATYVSNDKILKKETVLVGKKEKIQISFNREFWLSLPKPCSIYLDEIHFIADSRESQSQSNKAVTELISMARRIIGFDKYGYGDFTVIAQRLGSIDKRLRELATCIIWNKLHWTFYCENCEWVKYWNSDDPNLKTCPNCDNRSLVKSDYFTERLFFNTIEALIDWLFNKDKTYYDRDIISDIEDYFKYFYTLQYMKAEKK